MLQSSSCTLVSWFGPLVCWYSLQYFCPEPWYFNFPTDALSNILELIFSTSINYHINLSFIHIIHGHSWAFVTNFVTTTICSSYFSKKSDLSNFWTPEGYTIHWVLEPFYQEISEILLVIFLLPCEHSIKKKKSTTWKPRREISQNLIILTPWSWTSSLQQYEEINFHCLSHLVGASLVAQLVKTPPAMQETLVQFLSGADLLKEG